MVMRAKIILKLCIFFQIHFENSLSNIPAHILKGALMTQKYHWGESTYCNHMLDLYIYTEEELTISSI